MRTLSLLFALFIHGCSCSGAFAQNREVTGDIFPGLVAERNFVINGSFERGTQGVIAQSGTAVASTTNPIQGSRSLLISGVTTAGHTIRILYRGLQPGESGGDCILNFKYRGVGSAYKAYVYDTVAGVKLTSDIALSDESDPTKALKINPTVFKCPAASASPNAELRLEALVNNPGSLSVDEVVSGVAHFASTGTVGGSEILLSASRTTGQNITSTAATPIAWNAASINVGGALNTSTGTWTSPGNYDLLISAGIYFFNYTNAQFVYFSVIKNGVLQSSCGGVFQVNGDQAQYSIPSGCVVSVLPGDTIVMRIASQADTSYTVADGSWISITGFKKTVTGVVALVPDETVFSAEVNCSSSSSAISQSKQGWISSVGNVASGACTVNFPINQFTEGPSCEVTASSVGAAQAVSLETGNVSTNGFTMYCFAGSACTSWTANIMCQRQESDYNAARNRFINYNPDRVVTVSSAYTATIDDKTIRTNTASGDVTITLPLASSMPGKKLTIAQTSDSNGTIVARSGSDTICGQNGIVIFHSRDSVTLQSDGTNWFGATLDSCHHTATALVNLNGSGCSFTFNDPTFLGASRPSSQRCNISIKSPFNTAQTFWQCTATVSSDSATVPSVIATNMANFQIRTHGADIPFNLNCRARR